LHHPQSPTKRQLEYRGHVHVHHSAAILGNSDEDVRGCQPPSTSSSVASSAEAFNAAHAGYEVGPAPPASVLVFPLVLFVQLPPELILLPLVLPQKRGYLANLPRVILAQHQGAFSPSTQHRNLWFALRSVRQYFIYSCSYVSCFIVSWARVRKRFQASVRRARQKRARPGSPP